MKIIERLLALILFVVMFGFAIANTDVVNLRFFFTDMVWRLPLVVYLLVFFAAGVAMGLLAIVPTWFRQKREAGKLRKQVKKLETQLAAANAQLSPPAGSAKPMGTVLNTSSSSLPPVPM